MWFNSLVSTKNIDKYVLALWYENTLQFHYNHFHPIFEKPGLMRPLLISDNIVELQILYIPDKFQLWYLRMRQPNSACHFSRKEIFTCYLGNSNWFEGKINFSFH